jgi:HEAT repeat protein
VLAMLLSLLLVASPAAPPGPSPEVRAEVAALLGVLDRPVSPDSFRRFGAEGEAALADIALSRDLPPRRSRALEVLSALSSPRAEEVHRAVAASPDAPPTTRRTAVLGLGRLLPKERAAAALRPFLERDRDPRVRAAAAEALAQAAPAEACGAVRAQAGREDEAGTARFGRALAACAKARPR